MVKFYFVDNDIQNIRILEDIIEEANLGYVLGYSIDAEEAIGEIILKKPDIVLLTLERDINDGIRVIVNVKAQFPDSNIIVLSSILDKKVVGQVYLAGAEFFINMPINFVEICHVINQVKSKIVLEEKLNIIKSLFSDETTNNKINNQIHPKELQLKNIRMIFSRLGIMGEKGGEDIVDICKYIINNNIANFEFKINEICKMLSDNPKAMEQRMRRAINKGLINIASVGIEDYMNENFIRYSNSLYDFENVKAQMDCIRGDRCGGGKISVKRFIENLLLLTEGLEW